MKKIQRNELLDLATYEGVRERFRARVMNLKKHRRIPLGHDMTLIFENHETMLFQVQEMLRTERITREDAILHELETYNELVPAEGELSATLMIEYTDKSERAQMLEELHDLPGRIRLTLGDEQAVAEFRPNDGEEPGRLPAVNYLRFEAGADAASRLRDPVVNAVIECDHPRYPASTPLGIGPRTELAGDLEKPDKAVSVPRR